MKWESEKRMREMEKVRQEKERRERIAMKRDKEREDFQRRLEESKRKLAAAQENLQQLEKKVTFQEGYPLVRQKFRAQSYDVLSGYNCTRTS